MNKFDDHGFSPQWRIATHVSTFISGAKPKLRQLSTLDLALLVDAGQALARYGIAAAKEFERRTKESNRNMMRALDDRYFAPVRYWSKKLIDEGLSREQRLNDERLVLANAAIEYKEKRGQRRNRR